MHTPTPPARDHEILTLFDRGERRTALRLLVKSHSGAVFRYCWRVLADSPRAEDVVVRVFVDAFHGLVGFDRQTSLRTWLLRFAYRQCLAVAKDRADSKD